MDINQIQHKEDLILAADTLHQLSAEEFNAIIDYLQGIVWDTVSLPTVSFSIQNDMGLREYMIPESTKRTAKLKFTPKYTTRAVASDGTETVTEELVQASATIIITSPQSTQTTVLLSSIITGVQQVVDLGQYLQQSGRYTISLEATAGAQTALFSWIVNVTAMNLTAVDGECNFWAQPFVRNQQYRIGAFKIEGRVDKTIHVLITGNGVEKNYESYIGTDIIDKHYINLPANMHPGSNGVYRMKIWVLSEQFSSNPITINIMCVTSRYASQALVCVNDVAESVPNYTLSTLFRFATYNGGSVSCKCAITTTCTHDGIDELLYETEQLYNTGTINECIQQIDVVTENDDVVCTTTIKAEDKLDSSGNITNEGNFVEVEYALDNGASFPAVTVPNNGFDLVPARRSNSERYKSFVYNNATNPASLISSQFTNVQFVDGIDGWTTESYMSGGQERTRKVLLLPAGEFCKLLYNPFSAATPNDVYNIHITFKASNVIDYTEPIISICDADTSNFVGLKIYPNKIIFHTNVKNNTSDDVSQSYNLPDEEIQNVQIVIDPNNAYGRIICIYVNGVRKCEFEYSALDSMRYRQTTSVSDYIRFGSNYADLTIYLFKIYKDESFNYTKVLQNYYSSLSDNTQKAQLQTKDNSIFDNDGKISKQVLQANGVTNYFVVSPSENTIPEKTTWSKNGKCVCNFEMHYGLHPEWDYTIQGGQLSGQGTTSMDYYRWNLRIRTDKGSPIISDCANLHVAELKNTVKINSTDPAVKRITAKKNYASSIQSHKIGSTRAYNDLRLAVCGSNEVGGRTAVYLYPAYGFSHFINENNEDVYEFIGLYTIGPDKGDKATFAFDNSSFKNKLIDLEGVDHNPMITQFRYPWLSNNVFCRYNVEKDSVFITHMRGGNYEDAWEIGNCHGLSVDSSASLSQIQLIVGSPTDVWGTNNTISAWVNKVFKPIYNIIYDNSPFVSYMDLRTSTSNTLAYINQNPSLYNNQVLWINGDPQYEIYYLNTDTQDGIPVYVDSGKNMLTDLNISSSELVGMTAALKNQYFIDKRVARFKRDAFKTDENENDTSVVRFNFLDTLFHYCFCVMMGASDNFAKNTYPYLCSEECTWRWRQDDLDTLFDIDNQGLPIKSYSIEYMDNTPDGNPAFKGRNSALWTLIYLAYDKPKTTEISDMFSTIILKMKELSGSNKPSYEAVMDFFLKYYWDNSIDYFTRSAYNQDAIYSYDVAHKYYVDNGRAGLPIDPLRLSLGSHEEAEKWWVGMRMVYIMSKYKCGMFFSSADNTAGEISFRLQNMVNLKFTTAIDMYPVVRFGNNALSTTDRVLAGQEGTIYNVGSSDPGDNTQLYILGTDYYTKIEGLEDCLVDTSLGQIELSANSKRLRSLELGGSSAQDVNMRITALDVNGLPNLEVLNVRNVPINGDIEINNCKRLREIDFSGTNINSISIKNGYKIESLYLPSSITFIDLRNLINVDSSDVSFSNDLSNIETLIVENSPNLHPIKLFIDCCKAKMSKYGNTMSGGDYYSFGVMTDAFGNGATNDEDINERLHTRILNANETISEDDLILLWYLVVWGRVFICPGLLGLQFDGVQEVVTEYPILSGTITCNDVVSASRVSTIMRDTDLNIIATRQSIDILSSLINDAILNSGYSYIDSTKNYVSLQEAQQMSNRDLVRCLRSMSGNYESLSFNELLYFDNYYGNFDSLSEGLQKRIFREITFPKNFEWKTEGDILYYNYSNTFTTRTYSEEDPISPEYYFVNPKYTKSISAHDENNNIVVENGSVFSIDKKKLLIKTGNSTNSYIGGVERVCRQSIFAAAFSNGDPGYLVFGNGIKKIDKCAIVYDGSKSNHAGLRFVIMLPDTIQLVGKPFVASYNWLGEEGAFSYDINNKRPVVFTTGRPFNLVDTAGLYLSRIDLWYVPNEYIDEYRQHPDWLNETIYGYDQNDPPSYYQELVSIKQANEQL